MGTGCGAAEARLVWDQEVAGSNPATPTRHTLTGTLAYASPRASSTPNYSTKVVT